MEGLTLATAPKIVEENGLTETHPKILLVFVLEVDNLGEEEDDRCSEQGKSARVRSDLPLLESFANSPAPQKTTLNP
jgi:hypothetical protein